MNGVWVDAGNARIAPAEPPPYDCSVMIVRKRRPSVGVGFVLPWVAFVPGVVPVSVLPEAEEATISAADQDAVLKLYAANWLGDAEAARYLPEGGRWRSRVIWRNVLHDAMALAVFAIAAWAFVRRRSYVRLREVIAERRPRRLCVRCGYDRSATPGRRCPECGFGNSWVG
ncbi:MAG: hypothetical protein K2X32_13765 [Phycisphaerales bacterium]|nr:hypothetical protein [Phycisphaerales bacterium]